MLFIFGPYPKPARDEAHSHTCFNNRIPYGSSEVYVLNFENLADDSVQKDSWLKKGVERGGNTNLVALGGWL